MHWLIHKVLVVDPTSDFHLQQVDLEIRDGRIQAIGTGLKADGAELIVADGWHVSPGWVDLGAEVGDPGFEHREDITSLLEAAAKGGFTAVGVWPNTQPTIHDKAGIHYLRQRSQTALTTLLPIGAISRDTAGVDITEMLDMRTAGAVAFSDGHHSIQHAGLMLRALLYVKTFGGVVINQPLDFSIAGKGQLHEGIVSTTLGMTGIPGLAEELMVERDLRLAEYTGSRLHLSHLSTAGSVEKVRGAKAKGVQVTASVAALNLLFEVEALEGFDPNFKVMPPLRSAADREALLAGLRDGTIDSISSHHVPREAELKQLEFPYADFGALGLTTSFATARTALAGDLDEITLINALAHGPRRVLDLPVLSIEKDAVADLTFYEPNEDWIVTNADLHSRSQNSPLLGKELRGRVKGVIKGEQAQFSKP